MDITLSTLPPGLIKPARAAAMKRALFHAILDEEAPKLTNVGALVEQLRREIG